MKKFALLVALLLPCLVTAPTVVRKVAPTAHRAVASFYGDEFQGRTTANGEKYNSKRFTVAHKTLPFGTKLKITNPRNGRIVFVRVNDRGPFIKGRDYDLSKSAAKRIGLTGRGVAVVTVERI